MPANQSSSKFLAAGLLSLAACFLGACTAVTDTSTVTKTSEAQTSVAPPGKTAAEHDTALVRFVNADSLEEALDVMTPNGDVFSNVTYRNITPYKELPRGFTLFKMRQVGGQAELGSARLELMPGRHYTFVGLQVPKGGSRLIGMSDNIASLDPAEARIRLINATADVDDLDLFLGKTDRRIMHGVDAGSITSFADVPGGTVDIRMGKQAGPVALTNLPVQANHLYTYIVIGRAAALDVVQIVDQTTAAGSAP
ncbi:MAG: DUF4397 domain-containing protein [Acidobacteriota bacterium]